MDVAYLYLLFFAAGIAFTIFMLVRYGRKSIQLQEWSPASGIVLLLPTLLMTYSIEHSRPFNIVGVMGISTIILVTIFIPAEQRSRKNLTAFLLTCWGFGMILLWMHWTTDCSGIYLHKDLPRQPYFSISSTGAAMMARMPKPDPLPELIQRLSTATAKDTTKYPAQWLSASPMIKALPLDSQPTYTEYHWRRLEYKSCWHTGITQMYQYTVREEAPWYPGGRPKEGVPKIVYRVAKR